MSKHPFSSPDGDFFDYSTIPEHCRTGMKLYIEHGIIPGDFLKAVICNDLVGAAAAADWINQRALFSYAAFLWNAPGESWGSHEAMQRWCEVGGLQGLTAPKEESHD